MTTNDDGGPAFPPPYANNSMKSGMSLRDYFAAKAMHQFLAGAVLPAGFDASEALALAASRSYEVADAMMKARQA